MIPPQCWALVPLRDLVSGKERLAPALGPSARGQLVEAMARDLIDALLDAGFAPERVVLVSNDDGVASLGRALGVGVLATTPVQVDPLNAALLEAARYVESRGAHSVLILHADLPAASPEALRALCARHEQRKTFPRATLVADRAGSGTNCLLLSPPVCLPLGFGVGSRQRHRDAAAGAGVDYSEFSHACLALDVDLPADLRALVQAAQSPDNAPGEHTRAWLATQAPSLPQ